MSTKKYISDEFLASFIDGNTTSEQNAEVMDFLSDSPSTFEEFQIAAMAANSFDNAIQSATNDNIDILGTAAIIGGGVAAKLFGNVSPHIPHMAALSDDNTISSDRFETHHDSTNEEVVYKAPTEVMSNSDIGFIEQNDDIINVAKCQQHILHQYGIERSEQEVLSAIKNNWGEENSSLYNIGGLLEKFDIPVTRYENANVITAAKELAEGHSVVVVANSRNLWNVGLWEGHFDSKEEVLPDKPDHSFVTVGINTVNPHDVRIEISEVGQDEIKLNYSFSEFMNLWRDNSFFMVSTNQAIPNYNPEMVNFDYSYLGSLSNVGGLPYPEFEMLYDLSMSDAADVNFLNKLIDTYCLAVDSKIYFPEPVQELSTLSLGESSIVNSTIEAYINSYHLNEMLSESVDSYQDYYCAMEEYFERLENITGSDFSDNYEWYSEQQNLI